MKYYIKHSKICIIYLEKVAELLELYCEDHLGKNVLQLLYLNHFSSSAIDTESWCMALTLQLYRVSVERLAAAGGSKYDCILILHAVSHLFFI